MSAARPTPVASAIRPRGAARSARAGQSGFTLVEILLGLTLLALVLSLVQGVYSGALRSRDRAQDQTEKSHSAALVLHNLADELASALPQGQEGRDLVLEADENLDSKLEFSADLPVSRQDADEDASGGLARVAYQLERAEDGTRTLTRTDSRNAATSTAEGGGASGGEALLRGLSRFRVRLLVGEEKWRESSSGADAAEGHPRAVAVEVAWKEGKSGDGPERALRTLVPLYSALDPP